MALKYHVNPGTAKAFQVKKAAQALNRKLGGRYLVPTRNKAAADINVRKTKKMPSSRSGQASRVTPSAEAAQSSKTQIDLSKKVARQTPKGRRKQSAKNTAMHEFGHAVGLVHEEPPKNLMGRGKRLTPTQKGRARAIAGPAAAPKKRRKKK